MSLPELLERVQSATGADRAIDEAILRALGVQFEGQYWWWPGDETRYFGSVPRITASIDAAVALVERALPGAFYLLGKGKVSAEEPPYGCQLLFGSDEILGESEGDCLPLAICAALLSALIAREERKT